MTLSSRSNGLVLAAILSVVFFGLALGLAAEAFAGTKIIAVDEQRFGTIQVVTPDSEPSAFVILIMGPDFPAMPGRSVADELADHGAAVAIIDQPLVQSILGTPREGDRCIGLFGDMENLARLAERAIDMKSWEPPVLFGIGQGGTVAYLSLAQAPPNTAAGAVSLGFSRLLASKIPLCSGAPLNGSEMGQFAYGATPLPGRWTIITRDPNDASLTPFLNANPGARAERGSPEEKVSQGAAIESVFEVAAPKTATISDLPIVELPAKQPKVLAIFFSGDGGWRDVDKQIGEALSQNGVAVVGVDALRYFWSRKDPSTIAADIERIIRHYGDAWQVVDISLIGYSFGAAAIPLAWPKLDPSVKKAIKLVALLGPEPVGRLQMSMSGWLGLRSSEDIDLRPFLAQMPKSKIMCVFSVEEKKEGTTGCTLSELDAADRIERTGGHHFGGAYQEIAQLILGKLTSLNLLH